MTRWKARAAVTIVLAGVSLEAMAYTAPPPVRVAPVPPPAPIVPPPPVTVAPLPTVAPRASARPRTAPAPRASAPVPAVVAPLLLPGGRPRASSDLPPPPPVPTTVPVPSLVHGGGRCPAGMADIPGGTFTMGALDGEAHEKPLREITLAPYCLDVTEVTVGAYAACPSCRSPATFGLCNAPGMDRDSHPQNCVSWDDAVAYCASVGKQLPTEAQWEFAARGGSQERKWPWGAAPPADDRACWNRWDPDDRGTCAVGAFPEGPFGLKDMAGNVWEWVADWYGPHAPLPGQLPPEGGKAAGRVLRGGAWSSTSPGDLRGSNRTGMWPTNRDDYLGFRCAARP